MALTKSFPSSGAIELADAASKLGISPAELTAAAADVGGTGILPNDFWGVQYMSFASSNYNSDYDDATDVVFYDAHGTIQFSSNQVWAVPFTTTPFTGVGAGSMTINLTTNTGKSPRVATITLTRGSDTVTCTVTQGAAPPDYFAISLGDSLISGNHACIDYSTSPTNRYIPTGKTWATTTVLKSNLSGSASAPAGYYSDGGTWRYWTGAVFSSSGGCTV